MTLHSGRSSSRFIVEGSQSRIVIGFAVLFGLVEFWRTGQNKTTNTYVIEISTKSETRASV